MKTADHEDVRCTLDEEDDEKVEIMSRIWKCSKRNYCDYQEDGEANEDAEIKNACNPWEICGKL